LYARSNGYVGTVSMTSAVPPKGEISGPRSPLPIDRSFASPSLRRPICRHRHLAKITADLWQALRHLNSLTPAALMTAQRVQSSAANLLPPQRRTWPSAQACQGFTKWAAPFDGVGTRRNATSATIVTPEMAAPSGACLPWRRFTPLRLYVLVCRTLCSSNQGYWDCVTRHAASGWSSQYQMHRCPQPLAPSTSVPHAPWQCRNYRIPNPQRADLGFPTSSMLPITTDAKALVVPTNVLLFRSRTARSSRCPPAAACA